jgi:hypothetical protein
VVTFTLSSGSSVKYTCICISQNFWNPVPKKILISARQMYAGVGILHKILRPRFHYVYCMWMEKRVIKTICCDLSFFPAPGCILVSGFNRGSLVRADKIFAQASLPLWNQKCT